MSVHASAWAWKQEVDDPSTKLVLLKLADSANDDGVCWPSQRTLARECGLTERSIRYKLGKLVNLGLLKIEERRRPDGSKASNLYYLATGNELPQVPEEASFRGDRKQIAGHEPSLNRSSSTAVWNGPQMVGGKKVTVGEAELAVLVLEAFNEASGKDFRGKDWLRAIVSRLREYPDVSLEKHKEIIREQFDNPWWKGDPTPSVIYGNGKTFDRAVNSAKGEKRERKYSRV